MDVGIAIDAESETVQHRTSTGGAWNSRGEWVSNPPLVTPILAAIQPVTGNKLMDMPEGIRTEAEWLGWSRVTVVLDDEIQHAGVWYRVIFSRPRAMDNFTRFVLGRLK